MPLRWRRVGAGAAVIVISAVASPAAWATPRVALHVIPFPTAPDAAPSSQIIFSSLAPSDLRTVSVTGSQSGRHPGHLAKLPDRAGTAFAPDRRFTPGERVNVHAALRSSAAGTASGDPGASALNFSFTVAQASARGLPAKGPLAAAAAKKIGPAQKFHSEPRLRPPAVSFSPDPDQSSGDIFLTPVYGPQSGPMIEDSDGQLVWFRPVGGAATNLEVQRYRGQPVLTWWQGPAHAKDIIMSRSYRIMRVLHAGNGYTADAHEFQLTPQGTALLEALAPVKADLTSVGGPSSGTVYDDVIQELDIKTGRVLWEWHSLGHVPLTDSYVSYTRPYDYFHLNSIQQLPGGNLLVSARHTWAVYKINRRTGRIMWTLGGKHSSFSFAPGAEFAWQHDARLRGSELTLFDDAAPQEEQQSSGKVLRLDMRSRTAKLIRRYTHSPPLLSAKEGNMQTLPGGNVFIGWGGQPDFSEYTRSGRQIFNGSFAEGVASYRAYRFTWSGHPRTRPATAAAASAGDRLRVWVSWNGATDVRWWRLLGGPKPHRLKPLKTRRAAGFETALTVRGRPRYLAVQALDLKRRVLAVSRTRRGPS